MNDEFGALKSAKSAYEILVQVSGDKDLQTNKTLLNYALTLSYFEKYQEAKDEFTKLTTLYTNADEKIR